MKEEYPSQLPPALINILCHKMRFGTFDVVFGSIQMGKKRIFICLKKPDRADSTIPWKVPEDREEMLSIFAVRTAALPTYTLVPDNMHEFGAAMALAEDGSA